MEVGNGRNRVVKFVNLKDTWEGKESSFGLINNMEKIINFIKYHQFHKIHQFHNIIPVCFSQ